MGIQTDLTDAMEHGRDELVRTMAEHGIRPTVVESGGSSLLGKSAAPTFRVDAADGPTNVVDRQTTSHIVDTLGLDSEADCERVREEIESHPAWE